MLGIVRGDSLLHLVENHLVVFVVAERRFRDNLARDFGDFVLVVAINFDAGVAVAGVLAVEIRTAGGNGGNHRQQQTDSSMELAKFLVAVKGKVQMRALQVCPAVTLAVENAVVSLVNVEAIVRPEFHFCRIHERVASAWQKHRVDFFELLVRTADFVEEPLAKSVKCRFGVCALEFEHMAYKFVRKPDIIVFDVRKLVAVFIFSEGYIGARQHVQRVAIDNHEFHFNAEAFPKFEVFHSINPCLSVILSSYCSPAYCLLPTFIRTFPFRVATLFAGRRFGDPQCGGGGFSSQRDKSSFCQRGLRYRGQCSGCHSLQSRPGVR